jgi:hypothetical protein
MSRRSGNGKHGVDYIALNFSQVIALYAMLILDVANEQLNTSDKTHGSVTLAKIPYLVLLLCRETCAASAIHNHNPSFEKSLTKVLRRSIETTAINGHNYRAQPSPIVVHATLAMPQKIVTRWTPARNLPSAVATKFWDLWRCCLFSLGAFDYPGRSKLTL